MSKKSYCVDASVLLDNPLAVKILYNGLENDIYLPAQIFSDLDNLKKNPRLSHIVKDIIDNLYEFRDHIIIIPNYNLKNNILDDFETYYNKNKEKIAHPFIFVTNNKLLQLNAHLRKLTSEDFKESNPYESESQSFTGFINSEEDELIENSFYWKDGKLHYFSNNTHKLVDYENSIWKLKPRTPYQNAAMELLLNPNLDITTIQSCAGFGKTYLALAAALHWTIEKKQFNKIYVFKHTVDVGDEKLGFLPGDMMDKTGPYFRAIHELIKKLHSHRIANKLFSDLQTLELNSHVIEYLPINFIRGMNIDNGFVIIDEGQNFARQEMKVILSRMGEGSRVILLGDVEQIDSPYLNQFNNGLNWCVKAFKGLPNYGHIVLKGKYSRGKIADMVRNSIL